MSSAPVTPGPGRLSLRDKASLAAEILVAYVAVRRQLRRSDFRSVVSSLRDVPPGRPAAGVADPAHAGARLGRAVVRTLRPLPADSRCLVRALVLTRLLARRGIPSSVVLGVRGGGEFEAHAWVEYGEIPLLAPAGPGYQRLVEL